MMSLIFFAYALAQLALFVWALVLFLRFRDAATVPLLIVLFGLIYDNGILATGAAIGHGDLLERLSIPRFFLHAFGTPLLMLTGLGLMRRSGAAWTRSPMLTAGIVVLTLAMIAVGVDAELLALDLQAMSTADLISYGNAASHGPPVAPVVTIAVLIFAGVVVWRHARQPSLFFGALAQFAAAATASAFVFAGNLGELALMAGLVATDSKLRAFKKIDAPAQGPRAPTN